MADLKASSRVTKSFLSSESVSIPVNWKKKEKGKSTLTFIGPLVPETLVTDNDQVKIKELFKGIEVWLACALSNYSTPKDISRQIKQFPCNTPLCQVGNPQHAKKKKKSLHSSQLAHRRWNLYLKVYSRTETGA